MGSKAKKGYGYQVIYETRKTRNHGVQTLPKQVCFESENDFLRFIGKKQEFKLFKENTQKINSTFPILKNWLNSSISKILKYQYDWEAILKVCHYFSETTSKNQSYIRELPIPVPTKFIENHQGILTELLDIILPNEKVNPEITETSLLKIFCQKYYLKYDIAFIHFRFLSENQFIKTDFGNLTELQLRVKDFEKMNPDCDTIFITENKTNALSFPSFPKALVIFGSGKGITFLKDISWLKMKKIYYWGDIDTHGFEILSILRRFLPHVESLMMDEKTFVLFKDFWTKGKQFPSKFLENLTSSEQDLFQKVYAQTLRLEQEHILQSYVLEKIQNLRN